MPLGRRREDLFIDVFSNDFMQIIKAIEKDKKRKKDLNKNTGADFAGSMISKGIGNETKFGKSLTKTKPGIRNSTTMSDAGEMSNDDQPGNNPPPEKLKKQKAVD